jgi:hypothetical protein
MNILYTFLGINLIVGGHLQRCTDLCPGLATSHTLAVATSSGQLIKLNL